MAETLFIRGQTIPDYQAVWITTTHVRLDVVCHNSISRPPHSCLDDPALPRNTVRNLKIIRFGTATSQVDQFFRRVDNLDSLASGHDISGFWRQVKFLKGRWITPGVLG